jgi:hypothetical protein
MIGLPENAGTMAGFQPASIRKRGPEERKSYSMNAISH